MVSFAFGHYDADIMVILSGTGSLLPRKTRCCGKLRTPCPAATVRLERQLGQHQCCGSGPVFCLKQDSDSIFNQNPDPNIKVGIEQKSFLSATLRIGSQCC